MKTVIILIVIMTGQRDYNIVIPYETPHKTCHAAEKWAKDKATRSYVMDKETDTVEVLSCKNRGE